MSKLEYNYIPPSEDNLNTHMWTGVGENGGIHIWARPAPELDGHYFSERYYGGIEVHRKITEVDEYRCSHENCWLIGGPCYHDGSSLYFSERIEPMFRNEPLPFGDAVHNWMYAIIHNWYQSHLENHD